MFLTDGNHIGDVMGCISFVCSGCAEHVLANEVVRNTARTNRTVCGVYLLRGQIKLTSSKVRLYFFKKNKGKGPDLLEFDFNVHDAFS
jgi:hypothetical protein